MKKRFWLLLCLILIFLPLCSSCTTASKQSDNDQPAAVTKSDNIDSNIDKSEISSQNTENAGQNNENFAKNNEDAKQDAARVNQTGSEDGNMPFWAKPAEEHGQLFTGLNLDGIGDHDDEAYVSLYVWDNNGFDRYDASQIVIRIHLGTGDTTAHIVPAVGSYQFYTGKLFSENKDAIVLEVNNQYANSGQVSVFAFDVYGAGEADPFPSVVERLNTSGETPVLSVDGEKLYSGSPVLGTSITDIENKPLQGITLHSSGDGYPGPIDDHETQIIYWNGEGWIVL